MKKVGFLLALLLTVTTAAQAEGESRAMLLAKRVAAMENQRDLPSRAVWLSHRVVKNSRDLAFFRTKAGGKRQRPANSLKN